MEPKVRVSGFPYVPAHPILIDLGKKSGLGKVDGTAMLRVEAPPHVVKARLAVDLVMVVDVSMGGAAVPSAIEGELRLDVLKKAMKFVISQLRDKDRLAIVAFNDNVINDNTTELFEISGDGRKSAETKVDDLIVKGGGTAFKPPLEHAISKILDVRGDKSRVGFILLVSDGKDKFKWDNKISTPTHDTFRGLLAKHPVYTFGLGTAHDSKALFLVANESNGTYSSIPDNLESKLMEAFAVFLGGLNTIVAVNTKVSIKDPSFFTKQKQKKDPSYKEEDEIKIKIKRIDSGGYKNTISRDGTSREISVGILFADEVKDFIVHYEIHIFSTKYMAPKTYYERTPFIADGEYENIPGRKSIIGQSKFILLVGIHTEHMERPFKEDFLPYVNVLQQMVRFSILELLDTENGDNSALQTRWGDFKKSKLWEDAEKFRLDLGGLNQDIDAMVSNMERAWGVACVYSWVSSYRMQRATTTGLPSVTAAFLTNSMKAMIKKTARNNSEADAAPQQPLGEESRKCKLAFDLLGRIDTQLDLLLKLQDTVAGTESHTRDMAGLVHPGIGLVHQGIHQTMKQAIGEWRASQ